MGDKVKPMSKIFNGIAKPMSKIFNGIAKQITGLGFTKDQIRAGLQCKDNKSSAEIELERLENMLAEAESELNGVVCPYVRNRLNKDIRRIKRRIFHHKHDNGLGEYKNCECRRHNAKTKME